MPFALARSAIALPTASAAALLPVFSTSAALTSLSKVDAAAITSEPVGAISCA